MVCKWVIYITHLQIEYIGVITCYNPLTNYVQLPGTIKWGIWTKICTPKKNWFPHLSIILGNEIEIEIHWNSYIFVKQVFAIIFSYRSQPDRIFSIREISDPLCFLFGILFVDGNPAGWPVGCYTTNFPRLFIVFTTFVVSDFDRSMGEDLYISYFITYMGVS